MKLIKYNKKNNLVTFSNSILKAYKCPTYHKGMSDITHLLKRKKKVCIILFDGLGKSIIKNILPKTSTFRKHYYYDMTSTFPPTTVAATNGLLSGKYPNETGWIGWTTYLKSVNKVVEMFTGKEYVTKEMIKDPDLCRTLFPYKNIFDIIKEKRKDLYVGTIYGQYSTPGRPTCVKELFDQINNELCDKEKALVYAYYPEPDSTLHSQGVYSEITQKLVFEIDERLGVFASEHKDTLFVVIADHSHILVDPIYLNSYKEIINSLDGVFSIEARCASFRLKKDPECKKNFLNDFKKEFGKDFILLSKQEVYDQEIFGPNKYMMGGFMDFIGDYVAIATGKRYFELNKEPFISTHAGATDEEMDIQITVLNERPKKK